MTAPAQEFERGEPVIRMGDGLAVDEARARRERAYGPHTDSVAASH